LVKINSGDFSGSIAVVKSFDADGSNVRLELQDNGQIIELPCRFLDVAPISRADRVVVVKGDERGATGIVRSIWQSDAIISTDSGNLIINTNNVAPYARAKF
jgi:transcription elongation factor